MTTKRRSEAIWIESKSYWQIKVQKDGVRKAFTSSVKGRKGKHEAEAKADVWLEKGTQDMRFQAAWEEFLADQKERNGTSNYMNLQQYGRCYLLPNVGTRKLSTITPVMWQTCVDAAAKKGLSRRTCINIRASINAFVKYALRARWDIQRLEAGDIIIPNSAQPQKEKRVLQPDMIRTLFADPTIARYGRKTLAHYAYAWEFLIVTGLRRGELCGLKTEDINGELLTIRRSVNAQLEETVGKNDNARRTIELTSVALNVLQNQKQMLKDQGIVSQWVFPDKYGERANPKHIYDQWCSWAKQRGIDLSIHEMRHTFISINKADLPIELLKSVVGHSASMDTFGVYGHEIDGERHRAAQIINDVFADILK